MEYRRVGRIEQLRRVYEQGFLSEAAFEKLKRDIESHASPVDARLGMEGDDSEPSVDLAVRGERSSDRQSTTEGER